MVPRIETRRLVLRAPTLEDIPAYEHHFVDYEVIRNLSAMVPWPYPAGGVEDHLRTSVLPHQGKDRWVWGIFLKEDPGELIGCVDLWREGKPEHRGFWLGKKFWGNGIMTEAVEPVMDFAFDQLGFEKLVFANAVGNSRSRRVKEKTGAKLLRVESAAFVDPSFTEHEIWELSREEWRKFRFSRRESAPRSGLK